MAPRIDQNLVAEIVRLHGTGLCGAQIAPLAGCNISYVSWHLRRLGLVQNRSTKFLTPYNGFFDVIDAWDKAYVLGFIAADGCVTDKGIEIYIHRKDIAVLEYIKAKLETRTKISAGSGPIHANHVRLRPNNIRLVEALIKNGITARKSLTLQWPSFLPDNLLWPFLLGCFDGDGTLGLYRFIEKRTKKQKLLRRTPRVAITCSLPFASGLSSFLEKFEIRTNTWTSHNRHFCIVNAASIDDCQRWLRLMYQKAEFCLVRKHRIAQKIMNHTRVCKTPLSLFKT